MLAPSAFEQVLRKYWAREDCEAMVVTQISGCYDPLPTVTGKFSQRMCFVGLVGNRTFYALQQKGIPPQ